MNTAAHGADAAAPPSGLVLDLDGFEGPIDLLLALARAQKVDLARISILALAEQYLAFIRDARDLRLDLASDWLVMAAWLAWLKSRLLLPAAPEEDGDAAGDAARLAWRLRRLEAAQEGARQLFSRPRLGVDVFARGMPEPLQIQPDTALTADMGDLLGALARARRAAVRPEPMRIANDGAYSVERAMARLRRMVGRAPEWRALLTFLPDGAPRRAALAAYFAAALELARAGVAEVLQTSLEGPIQLRAKRGRHGRRSHGGAAAA